LGPLFYYELVRLGRRTRGFWLRCVYALALLFALYLAYRGLTPNNDLPGRGFASSAALPAGKLTALAGQFVRAILIAQSVAISILTPAYLSGAIAEEKERGTLDLLLTTQLRNREIVLGKLAVRLLHIGGVLLAGLPLLAATQLWGGVDLQAVSIAFLGSGLHLLSIGSLSIFVSAGARTVTEALTITYVVIAFTGAACALNPLIGIATGYWLFEALNSPFRPAGWWIIPVAICLGVNGILSLLCLVGAISQVRPAAAYPEGFGGSAEAVKRRAGARSSKAPVLKVEPEKRVRNLPPPGEWPLLWKEVNRDGRIRFHSSVEKFLARWWPFILAGTALLGWYSFSSDPGPDKDSFRALLILDGILFGVCGLAWSVDVAFRAATSICRERVQGTLDGLRTLPCSRVAILGAKWLGAILASRIGWLLLLLLAFNLGTGFLRPLRTALLATSLAVQIAFLASLGLWISLRSKTLLRAQVTTALALLVFFFGGLLGSMIDAEAHSAALAMSNWSSVPKPDKSASIRATFYSIGLNPVGGWAFLFNPTYADYSPVVNDEIFATRLSLLACGILGYAVAAGLLWLDSWRRFARNEREWSSQLA
jgi:ABC-type transport system involved in multi-copper enzyme maturation permease subunit